MKGTAACLVLLGLLQATLSLPPPTHATVPDATIEGNYAMHVKNTGNDDGGYVSSPDLNLEFSPGNTYLVEVSVLIVSAQGIRRPFELRLDPISVYFDHEQLAVNSPAVAANTGYKWQPGTWYNIELRNTVYDLGDSGSVYVNGTLLSASWGGMRGRTIQKINWVGSFDIAEIYLDGISIARNGEAVYSEGFENGLAGLAVTRYGNAIVDTGHFGESNGFSSSLISLSAGDNATLVRLQTGNFWQGYGALFGSDLRIFGKVHNATSLAGVPFSPALLEYSTNFGATFTPLGLLDADENGNFAIVWKPLQLGLLAVRASYSQGCCFFGSTTSVYLDVTRAYGQLSISLGSSTTLPGFSVAVGGSLLAWDSAPIPGIDIVLAFTVPGASDWTTITSAKTMPDGKYSATWIAQATGVFTVRASWAGNGLHRSSNVHATLSSLVVQGRYVLSVVSDATVSMPAYDELARRMKFSIQGPAGKTGFADVSLPRELAFTPARVRVYANGTEVPFETVQSEDAVRLRIPLVFRSAYTVEIALEGETSSPVTVASLPWQQLVFVVSVGVDAFSAILFWRRRRRKETVYLASP